MKIENERELLNLARNPQSCWNDFEEKLLPIFNEFVNSGSSSDLYQGWALSIEFKKCSSEEIQFVEEHLMPEKFVQREHWKIFKSKQQKDDSYMLFDDSVFIRFHLHSFLWNF